MSALITGVTPAFQPTDQQYASASVMRFKFLRMVNRLNDTKYADGKLIFGHAIDESIGQCIKHGFIPLITLGQLSTWMKSQVEEFELRAEAEASAEFSASDIFHELIINSFDWELYDQSIYETLNHVCNVRGIQNPQFEVGAEFLHKGKMSWMSHDSELAGSDKIRKMNDTLYWYTAKAVMRFEKDYPAFDIKLGGWASGITSKMNEFVANNMAVKMDFISAHCYLFSLSQRDLQNLIKGLKTRRPGLKFYITEFGVSPSDIETIDPRVASVLVKSFLELAPLYGIDLLCPLAIVAQSPNQATLYEADGTTLTPMGLEFLIDSRR